MNFIITILIRVVIIGLFNFLVEYVPRLWRWSARVARLSFHAITGLLIARWVTPKGHRPYGHYKASEGYKLLADEGYSVVPYWSSDAIEKLN